MEACLHAVPSVHEETEINVEGPSRARVTDGVDLREALAASMDDAAAIRDPNESILRFANKNKILL